MSATMSRARRRCELCDPSPSARAIIHDLHREHAKDEDPPDYLGLKRALEEEFDADVPLYRVREHFEEHVMVAYLGEPWLEA